MVVVVFRVRFKPGVDMRELAKVGERMYELVSSMPGYISHKDFTAEDGETVSLFEFDCLESVAAWREHPEHKQAQQRGREEFFAEYHIQVCAPIRDYRYAYPG
jgi:heme-degrading monooxygenase HmoA